MVTDEQRGRYGRWLRKERLGRGWSVDETRAKLARAGYRIGESSYAEWESGRKRPSRDAIPHLVTLFGTEPPEEAVLAPQSPDGLAELAAAIREQSAAIRQMAEAITASRAVNHEDAVTMTRTVLRSLTVLPGGEAVAELLGPVALPPDHTTPETADNEPAGSRGKR
jgi:transcriptional regulator with XRE-family HTH domain